MIPRDFINNVVDTQHNIINGLKALIDMQSWYVNKAVDEIEKYAKQFQPKAK